MLELVVVHGLLVSIEVRALLGQVFLDALSFLRMLGERLLRDHELLVELVQRPERLQLFGHAGAPKGKKKPGTLNTSPEALRPVRVRAAAGRRSRSFGFQRMFASLI